MKKTSDSIKNTGKYQVIQEITCCRLQWSLETAKLYETKTPSANDFLSVNKGTHVARVCGNVCHFSATLGFANRLES